jgi:hypothetical protein
MTKDEKVGNRAGVCLVQLMVATTDDVSYVYCGEVGGSVVNALHIGWDPRGDHILFLSACKPTFRVTRSQEGMQLHVVA